MISYEQARALIAAHPLAKNTQRMRCEDALGQRLAHALYAPMDLPPFDTSAVDGFALATLNVSEPVPLSGEVKAGAQEPLWLTNNHAMRIMTGALLPKGSLAVVMKEHVHEEQGFIRINAVAQPQDNIRLRGEDIKQGDRVAHAHALVTPALIGALHALGIDHIAVHRPPTISIVSTGDELVDAGHDRASGQVYYLMGPMLKAQAAMLGIKNTSHERVKDRLDDIGEAIKNALHADVVLITGGMSKGEYDLVRPVLKELDAQELFYEGSWRPGKPLWFGKLGDKRIFGLPGNPVAAFVCFHVFVRPLLLGANPTLLRGIMKEDYHKKAGFTFFVRAMVDENHELAVVEGQGSHQIVALSKANALVVVPEETSMVRAKESVWYYPL